MYRVLVRVCVFIVKLFFKNASDSIMCLQREKGLNIGTQNFTVLFSRADPEFQNRWAQTSNRA